jgi:hypothetical protein
LPGLGAAVHKKNAIFCCAIPSDGGCYGAMSFLRMTAMAVMLALALAFAGCAQSAKVKRPLVGASAVRFVDRPVPAASASGGMVAAELQPVDVVVPAEPIEPLANPRYPRAALGKVGFPVMVGVRITVDARGRVANVGPSMAAFSTGGEYGEEFQAAVERALAQWRFNPAELRHLVPRKGGPGQPDYWLVTRTQKTDYAFDVSFTFTTSGEVVPEGVRVAKSR